MAPDQISKERRSQIMASVRSKNTQAELTLRKRLWHGGARYRIHVKRMIGNPDIVFVGARLAVFIDSDFWHGKVTPSRLEKMSPYCRNKLEKNRVRDTQVTQELEGQGWTVLRVSERDVLKDSDSIANLIFSRLRKT